MAMEQKFKPGDIVRLKSGGPKMTVIKYDPAQGADLTCQWFEKDSQFKEKSFNQDALEVYQTESPIIVTGRPRRNFHY